MSAKKLKRLLKEAYRIPDKELRVRMVAALQAIEVKK